jgi:molecular chaperone GrpE
MTQDVDNDSQTEEFPTNVEPKQEPVCSIEETLNKELEESKDKYLRLLAEMENTRKRLQKEKQDATNFAVENIIAEFLIPLDNLENALGFTRQMSEETANWAKGFQMILEQFKDVLASNGVTPFASVGSFFDPHYHEAVEVEEKEECIGGEVLQEYVKGYKRGDRTIRPARVKVAKKSVSKAVETQEEQQ